MDTDNSAIILERMLKGAGVRRDSQLAEILGVSPQAISQARRKKKIPDGWIYKIAESYKLSADWIYFGDKAIGPRGPQIIPQVSPQSAPVGRTDRSGSNTLSRYFEVQAPQQNFPEMDLALIPLVAAKLAAGHGSLATEEDVMGYFSFRQDWLLRKGNPDQMVLMKVFGDSMAPDIQHGDMVLINQADTSIYGHAIYAVGVNDEIYVKQVESKPGSRFLLHSINPDYKPIEVCLQGDLADSVRVIGRVIWWCREA